MLQADVSVAPGSTPEQEPALRDLTEGQRDMLSQAIGPWLVCLERELNENPDDSAEAAIDRLLAGTAYRRVLSQLILDAENPVFPDDEFELGNNMYKNGKHGFYAWAKDPWGEERFLTLVPRGMIMTLQAPQRSWLDLFSDVLSAIDDDQESLLTDAA